MSSQAAPNDEKVPANWPRRVWLPGALSDIIATRIKELEIGTLSRYLVELIAHDLRQRRAHTLTGWLSHRPAEDQQAVDLLIGCHYRPFYQSNKEQIAQLVAHGFADALLKVRVEPLMTKVRHLVYLRGRHRGIMRERMEQLGFEHLSQYVISLIRFDLLCGGPHKHHTGKETRKECRALDAKTHDIFHNQPPKKCMIDYVIEEICGREMTPEERDEALRKVSEQFVAEAVAAQKRARRA